MKTMVRLLAALLTTVLVASMAPQTGNAERISPDLHSLPNVGKILKMSPEQVKQLRPDDVQTNGVVGGGLWWGGTYLDVLDTWWLANDTGQTPAQEILRLGSGRCTEQTVTSSITLTIQGSRGSNFQNAINSSFGFSASGTRTYTKTEKYCGPTEPNKLRIFYQQGIYNDHQALVTRLYYDWKGIFHHAETMDNRTVQVPHPSYPTRDMPWEG